MRAKFGVAGVAALILLFGGSAALAQSVPAAKGVPLGGFRLFPVLDVDANYDDNVYRTQAGAISDYFFSERPSVTLASQWGRHQLDLYAGFQGYQYATRTSENHNDWDVGGDGRLDITRGFDLKGDAEYAIEHEARTSPDQPNFARTPTRYALTDADAALEYHPYHFGLSVGGTFTRYDYDATPLIGLPPLNNTDRNRDEVQGYIKGSYEFSPGYAVYLQGLDRQVSYDLTLDRNGLNRNNSGYAVNAGLDMLVTNLVKGNIFVGYLDQHYHAPLVPISGFNFGANVDWNATPLWTFHLTASRILNGTTLNHASSEDDQTVQMAADYAFRRTMSLNAFVGYTHTDFNGAPRKDDVVNAGVGFNYNINELMTAKLGYDYSNRTSTIGGQNFDDNVVSVGIGFHV